ncbi:MAG TPA: LEA type 2 family protein [Steroidobacteraceae bacterium]
MRVLFVMLAALALGGCSALVPKLETPNLSIVNVQVEKSDLWEQRLKVRMRVQNPNERALPIRGLSYRLDVAGQELARGVSGTSFTVPAFGEAEFDMNVTANMASAIIRLLGSQDDSRIDHLDYRIVGKISLSEGFLRSIPFEQSGTFRLK